MIVVSKKTKGNFANIYRIELLVAKFMWEIIFINL